MKVTDLIKKLQEMPQDAEILIETMEEFQWYKVPMDDDVLLDENGNVILSEAF